MLLIEKMAIAYLVGSLLGLLVAVIVHKVKEKK